MRLSRIILVPSLFLLAALAALLAAWLSVGIIERNSQDAVSDALVLQGHEWTRVKTTGLQVVLSGTAPNEATRFRALAIAGSEVDATRVIDQMEVTAAAAITPPRFSIEILRNDAGISLIGLIPADSDRDALRARIKEIAGGTNVADLLETADYPMPAAWDQTLAYAIDALEKLPRSKISMDAQRVAITAISDSATQKRTWESELAARAPGGLMLSVDISAPRPVITPFTLRFLIEEDAARFDACSAHDEVGRARILDAAMRAGLTGDAECTLGLGVPSPTWAEAVVTGIDALARLEGGSLTFSDADVTLVAPDTTPQATFDKVAAELEADLPDLFSLHAVLPEPVKIDGSGEGDGPPEFVATRSPEGLVQLRGRLTDEVQRSATESLARARFGFEAVYAATRLDEDLPRGWSTRVLAGLEALSFLDNGAVVVQPDVVDVRGNTGDPEASAQISRILSEKLGEAQDFRVNVTYQEALDPEQALPAPEECVASINTVLSEAKITFAPGSANIDAEARATIDKIVELMKGCVDVPMEIAGYTDSQGREEMNRALSQSRAQAVLNALLARRVLTSNLTAHGYGEEDPIADNGTEEGREANRRINFRLIGAEDSAEETPDDQAPAEGAEEADDTATEQTNE
ncbi:OmpA family protein [Aliiroseovarius subalbicans]|uniref:OmpA family protein n=1 Tax=Aliiroseovarius subalbicans TaxID=2925840 RepID=UPI001F567535|nr:OmpA family protein [Aliiroseovarius subalbicans]MCI2399597.1 OmpA family protein [Aliiroseovarius subalbicans]